MLFLLGTENAVSQYSQSFSTVNRVNSVSTVNTVSTINKISAVNKVSTGNKVSTVKFRFLLYKTNNLEITQTNKKSQAPD